ncbi:MAG: peptide deformylase [Actinobacteria bacterium]|nr:MAG: peptide deformylase [Actinomycetota bacterium]
MSARPVLRYPHPVLKRRCRRLDIEADAQLMERVAGDLLGTIAAHPGCVGLAAPQLGELVRLVAVDVSEHPRATTSNGRLVLANPRITRREGSEVAREGCLSIPDLTANVRRAHRIALEATDALSRQPVSVDSEGFEARCLQHELDHLDGLLFLDRVDSLARDVFRRKRYQTQDAKRT